MCYGLKDETAVRKKTDVPAAASVDGVDKAADVSNAADKGMKTPPSSSLAANSGISQRKGRGKSILNAVDGDVSILVICELLAVLFVLLYYLISVNV